MKKISHPLLFLFAPNWKKWKNVLEIMSCQWCLCQLGVVPHVMLPCFYPFPMTCKSQQIVSFSRKLKIFFLAGGIIQRAKYAVFWMFLRPSRTNHKIWKWVSRFNTFAKSFSLFVALQPQHSRTISSTLHTHNTDLIVPPHFFRSCCSCKVVVSGACHTPKYNTGNIKINIYFFNRELNANINVSLIYAFVSNAQQRRQKHV